jgi:enamine deaminase RidA (YjgF/YER057c/UK114 family)
MSKPSERLAQAGITLPPVTAPVGAYVPAMRVGETIITSGQIPLADGKIRYTGKAGGERTLEDAMDAARICSLNSIAVAADAAGGVDNLTRVLKVVVYVASADGFTDQHKVANGASNLFVDVFGEAGKHCRAAVGMAELPLNATVEVDVTYGLNP